MTSDDASFQRNVARIDNPGAVAGHMPGHRARRLIDGSDTGFTDPFVLMAEDWMPHGAFSLHPHRGIETVTFVIEGDVEHVDNAGHHGIIRAGDAQWMTAGRGILHEENAPKNTIAHTLQLWVNLPAASKMTEPRYQNLSGTAVPVRREPGVEARIFSGRSGDVRSPTINHVPVTIVDARIDPGAAFRQRLPATDTAFILILDGSVEVGPDSTMVDAGDLAWLTRSEPASSSDVAITARGGPARLLLVSGRPLAEPVVFGGPFVMNTQEEIRQAFADYRAGRF